MRFLALVGVGWVAVRIVLLWTQTGSLPEAIRAFVPAKRHAPAVRDAEPAQRLRRVQASPAPARHRLPLAPQPGDPPLPVLVQVPQPYPSTPPILAAPPPPVLAQPWVAPTESRWSGSGWLLVRRGAGSGIAPGGQIGGSQGGVRIGYMLDRGRRIGAFARFTTPLSGRGREAAIGAEWQPLRATIRLVAEQRFAIDGGSGGPGIGVVAGDDRTVAGFRLESYGQAGAIKRGRIEPYADGAVRVTRGLWGNRLALGVGAWGAAQRDAARLDVGPSVTLAVPVAGRNIRIALDWRQRVAGSARPGSGPALTLGSDF